MSSNITSHTISTEGSLTAADWRATHEKHCERCLSLTQAAAARAAESGASMARRDRKTLGLILDMPLKAVTL